jgi:hypothetical protein
MIAYRSLISSRSRKKKEVKRSLMSNRRKIVELKTKEKTGDGWNFEREWKKRRLVLLFFGPFAQFNLRRPGQVELRKEKREKKCGEEK